MATLCYHNCQHTFQDQHNCHIINGDSPATATGYPSVFCSVLYLLGLATSIRTGWKDPGFISFALLSGFFFIFMHRSLISALATEKGPTWGMAATRRDSHLKAMGVEDVWRNTTTTTASNCNETLPFLLQAGQTNVMQYNYHHGQSVCDSHPFD